MVFMYLMGAMGNMHDASLFLSPAKGTVGISLFYIFASISICQCNLSLQTFRQNLLLLWYQIDVNGAIVISRHSVELKSSFRIEENKWAGYSTREEGVDSEKKSEKVRIHKMQKQKESQVFHRNQSNFF